MGLPHVWSEQAHSHFAWHHAKWPFMCLRFSLHIISMLSGSLCWPGQQSDSLVCKVRICHAKWGFSMQSGTFPCKVTSYHAKWDFTMLSDLLSTLSDLFGDRVPSWTVVSSCMDLFVKYMHQQIPPKSLQAMLTSDTQLNFQSEQSISIPMI